MRRADFDPSRVAVVEDQAPLQQSGAGSDEVGVRLYNSREIVLDVRANAAGFLVTSETQYPGWHAWIDGAEVPIVMTNGAFRGLAMPAGVHTVRFRFSPAILNIGLAISIAAAALIVLVYRGVTSVTGRSQ
jgi:uncharacterized membrane protein YfhO